MPDTVSPQLQADLALPHRKPGPPPTTNQAYQLRVGSPEQERRRIDGLLDRFKVRSEQRRIGGVPCFILTPVDLPASHRDRLLVHVHGGAYVEGAGISGTDEAIMMAAATHSRVVSIDYRMPPDFPFPAAMDDAMAVWKALLADHDARRMAIFGTSTGGGMTLAMVQRARREGLPLPAVIAAGTPWSDLSETGDSYFINAGIDPMQYDGDLSVAARLYAHDLDLKDPRLSPIYGDFSGFPPTILTSGTRDLFLSNTVRVNQKLRENGVETRLQVFEGETHAQYLNPDLPESAIALAEIARFFDRYLAN